MEKYTIERIINIIHCEIRLADDTGHLLERFGNLPENEDPFCTDPSFLRACLDREALPLPDIFCENTYIYYACWPVLSASSVNHMIWLPKWLPHTGFRYRR